MTLETRTAATSEETATIVGSTSALSRCNSTIRRSPAAGKRSSSEHETDSSTCSKNYYDYSEFPSYDTNTAGDERAGAPYDKNNPDVRSTVDYVNTPTATTDKPVTVKFVTCKRETFTMAFRVHDTIDEIKRQLSDLFAVSSIREIETKKDDTIIADETVLADLGATASGILELNLRISSAYTLNRDLIYGCVFTPDLITVRIQPDGKEVVVEIENHCREKKWLGGYRNKVSGKCYHHAETQTRRFDDEIRKKSSRYSMCRAVKDDFTNTPVNRYVQTLNNARIPSLNDKIINARNYVPYSKTKDHFVSEEFSAAATTTTTTTVATTNAATTHVKPVRPYIADREKEIKTTTTNPPPTVRKLSDVYFEIEKWNKRKNETVVVESARGESEQIRRRIEILNETRTFLLYVEREKHKIMDAVHTANGNALLNKAAAPIRFTNRTGNRISIENLRILKAQRLKRLFVAYKNGDSSADAAASVENRMKTIIDLRSFFEKCETYAFSADVANLLQRELNLLARRVDSTRTLKKRIERFVFHYLKQPEFRAEERTDADGDECCTGWRRTATSFEPYRNILARLQNQEMNYFKCYSSVCFKMRVFEMYYLVSDIWERTTIDGDDCRGKVVVEQLRITRWEKAEPWSPWNCIVLSKNQIKTHLSIRNVGEHYDKCFVSKVKNKHLKAKIYFNGLL